MLAIPSVIVEPNKWMSMHSVDTSQNILASNEVSFEKTHKMVSTHKFVVADTYIVCRRKVVFVFPSFTRFSSVRRENNAAVKLCDIWWPRRWRLLNQSTTCCRVGSVEGSCFAPVRCLFPCLWGLILWSWTLDRNVLSFYVLLVCERKSNYCSFAKIHAFLHQMQSHLLITVFFLVWWVGHPWPLTDKGTGLFFL